MATEIVMPKLGLNMTEGTIERWLVKEGDQVNEGDPIVEISSEKLTNEVEATASGTLIKIMAEEGSVIPYQEVMAYIGEAGEEVGKASVATQTTDSEEKASQTETSDESAKTDAKEEKTAPSQTKRETAAGKRIFITPLARKMAEKKGIDIARSEEHTSELQSRFDLVCRLLLEKKKSDIESKR